jgi:peptide deformylase
MKKSGLKNRIAGRICIFAFAAMLVVSGCGTLLTSTQSQASESLFSEAEIDLILSTDSKSPMRVFKTDSHSDSLLLRSQSAEVNIDTTDIHLNTLIKRMYITVNDTASLGVGIAAPQVGVLKRVIWVQRFDKLGEPFEAYLNPKIIQYSQLKQERREGCLSVPDRRGDPKSRSYAILLEYNRPDMSFHREMVEGFTAIIFQHEIDHLNGILFTDYLKE